MRTNFSPLGFTNQVRFSLDELVDLAVPLVLLIKTRAEWCMVRRKLWRNEASSFVVKAHSVGSKACATCPHKSRVLSRTKTGSPEAPSALYTYQIPNLGVMALKTPLSIRGAQKLTNSAG